MKGLTIIIIIIMAIIAVFLITGKKVIAALIPKSVENGMIDSGVFGMQSPEPKIKDTTQMDKVQGYTKDEGIAPGTYLTAGTQEAPLAFMVVGGVDTTPKTQTLFGSQSGEGGITAGAGLAGASGSRPGGTGTWTSAGYTTRY